MAKLTAKDYEILDFIYRGIKKNGYPPTVREICAAVNLNSPATVHARLSKLEAAGKIEKTSAKNRAMRVVGYPETEEDISETREEYIEVPVYGKITAGVPITAVEQLERHFPIPMSYVKNNEIFMLKVSGESMINVGIYDGDYIIIEKRPDASNGDIVAALINGEDATVKTFYKENGHYRLQPENDTMSPIIADNVEIIGKVIGVFRMF
ncbi:MAG: transcriptional repressor LexA [Clostridiales bacterium]|nr:transcriptional repressor LexA [Clostridiales bacterium]